MFHFPGCAILLFKVRTIHLKRIRFPHSEIFGSTVARHLPEAYRSYATSFIASSNQGIHHILLISHREIKESLLARVILFITVPAPSPAPNKRLRVAWDGIKLSKN